MKLFMHVDGLRKQESPPLYRGRFALSVLPDGGGVVASFRSSSHEELAQCLTRCNGFPTQLAGACSTPHRPSGHAIWPQVSPLLPPLGRRHANTRSPTLPRTHTRRYPYRMNAYTSRRNPSLGCLKMIQITHSLSDWFVPPSETREPN